MAAGKRCDKKNAGDACLLLCSKGMRDSALVQMLHKVRKEIFGC